MKEKDYIQFSANIYRISWWGNGFRFSVLILLLCANVLFIYLCKFFNAYSYRRFFGELCRCRYPVLMSGSAEFEDYALINIWNCVHFIWWYTDCGLRHEHDQVRYIRKILLYKTLNCLCSYLDPIFTMTQHITLPYAVKINLGLCSRNLLFIFSNNNAKMKLLALHKHCGGKMLNSAVNGDTMILTCMLIYRTALCKDTCFMCVTLTQQIQTKIAAMSQETNYSVKFNLYLSFLDNV